MNNEYSWTQAQPQTDYSRRQFLGSAVVAAASAPLLNDLAGFWEKGTGTICRSGPEGAAHKWCLSPFSLPRSCKVI